MLNLKEKISATRQHYGWYVLAASFIILFFNSGARTTFGILFKPMIAEFGWSRGTLSLAFFLNMIFYSLTVIVSGKLYDRYGPKWVLTAATIFVSLGYILISFISTIWEFYIYYGLFAAIGMGGTSIPLFAAIMSKWFNKWRGLIISLALSGNCLGQFALIPLFNFFTQQYGWRASYSFIGIIMFVVNMSLIMFVIRDDPDSLSIRIQNKADTGSMKMPVPLPDDLTLKEAMRTAPFWLFSLAMLICGSGDFLVANHLVPFVTDQGITADTAGNMLAWMGLTSLAGILIAGPVSDIIGNKIPIALTFFIRVLAFALILYDQSLISSYIFALTFGFTLLITAPLSTTLIGKIYGFSHIGFTTGFVNTVHFLGGGLWTYIGGLIYDRTGSYQFAFLLSAIMAFIAFVATLLVAEGKAFRNKKPGPGVTLAGTNLQPEQPE